MRTRVAFLAAATAAVWLVQPGSAYWRYGQRWPAGNIVMHLQMGSSGTLLDGTSGWNTVAEHALALWNPFLSGVEFRLVRDSTAGVAFRNDINNVVWSDDVYGEPFGDAIAYTKYVYRLSDNRFIEADVLFDRSRSWNSYRGNLRSSSGGGRLYDMRRVALHEFGHVLGLDHPDEHGQSVTAIMNSRVSNVDALQSDDIAGAAAIYGGTATPTPSNRAPTVTASCNPCTVQTGRTATLTASATDPDGDALTYRWTAARGTFSNATAASTVWTAPDQIGAVTATITVQDGRSGSATASLTLQVVPRDTLQADGRLLPGQSLTSGNSRFRLLYQADGNLVLYDDVARTAPWSSNTGGTSAGYTLLQGDGNLVVYDGQGTARWATGTPGSPNSRLVVQNDGNLVLYRSDGQPVWSTGTSATTPAPGSCTVNAIAVGTTVQGSWTSSCSSTRRAAYAQYYRFTLSAQARVQIDLTSPTADAYLYLLRGSDQAGSVVTEDDDSAGGLNSRILATLTAGTYVIEATTYSTETGAFSVSLTTL